MAIARRYSPFLQVVGVAVLIVVLTRPLIFDGYQRGADFWVHYWYVWHQGEAVRHGGPSLFLHDTGSVFTPRYAFYGGTLYAITGTLGLAVGMLRAYIATYLLACGAAYGGWWWLGRQAGLGRVVAHAPALVFLTSAYSITLLNPRSDWPEHVGVSMAPLLVASMLSVLRADRLRALPALALMVSGVLFFGSHNLSLLCGTALLAVLAALALLCVPQARRMVTRRGLLRVAVVLVPALLVDAWFLLPDLVYHPDTFVAKLVATWVQYLHQFGFLVSTPRLFALGRGLGDPIASEFGIFALPVLVIAWTVITTAVSRPRLGQPWLRMLLILAAVAIATTVAMTHVGLLVGPFRMVQFSFRLESYVNLAISGAVLAALVSLRQRPAGVRRACLAGLAVVLAISVVQAAVQIDDRRDTSRNLDLTANPRYYSPKGLTHAQDYGAGRLLTYDVGNAKTLTFSPKEVRSGSISGTIKPGSGEFFLTNIVTVPQFVRLTGAQFVGIFSTGEMFIKINPATGPGPAEVTISEAHPPAVVIGRWLTRLGLLWLATVFVVLGVRRRRRRRADRPPDGPDPVATEERSVAAAAG